MSAILSADDLNDFISPGVACIKPVETLPLQDPVAKNPYEVTTEDKVAAEAPPAQITLTDCLACSGCVTSAEAMLVSLQSHTEVLSTLDAEPGIALEEISSADNSSLDAAHRLPLASRSGKIFVASVSPQVRASLAATYGTSEGEAGCMIEQLLCGPQGIGIGGLFGNRFSWILDTNAMRSVVLAVEADDLTKTQNGFKAMKSPVLTSACPGWICYAEKTHPHVLPHLSQLKSPQALTGTFVKSVLSAKLGVKPSQVWHLAIMPCFDKKLEAARKELTHVEWYQSSDSLEDRAPIRDVDCVITAREILMLADERGISFPSLPREPVERALRVPFPDRHMERFLSHSLLLANGANSDVGRGTSGGFLRHVLATQQALHPESIVTSERGRNTDVVEYTISTGATVHFRAARYYGFRNIQNLVRKLRPPKLSRLPGAKTGAARKPAGGHNKTEDKSYAYVEVMACPGGCTNGGGQIKVDDLGVLQAKERGTSSQKEWLALVDEAYFSMDDSESLRNQITKPSHMNREEIETDDSIEQQEDGIDGISHRKVNTLITHWAELTGISREKLLYTTFNAVESDVGKQKGKELEHVVELASKIGGGW